MGYLKQSFKLGEIEIFMQLNIIFGWLVLKGVVFFYTDGRNILDNLTPSTNNDRNLLHAIQID